MNSLHEYSEDQEENMLFYEVVPHYVVLQRMVGLSLQEHFADSSSEKLSALELGCGTGITTEQILSLNPKITLDAIDNDEAITRQIRSRLFEYETAGRLRVHFVDINDYLRSQPNNSLDAVVSALVLHNCDNNYRKQTYIEIMRVLKKGGIFVNADKYATDDLEEHAKALQRILSQFADFEKKGRPDMSVKWTKHYLEDEAPNVILRESDYVRELQNNGFKNIRKIFREKLEAIYVAEK